MNQKVSQLAALASPTGDDLLLVVDDAGGTPTTKRAVVADVLAATTGERLLSRTVVDVNSTSAQDLYTVPVGKTLVVTRVVARNASTSLLGSGINLSFTEDGGGSVVATAVSAAALDTPNNLRIAAMATTYSTVEAGSKVRATPSAAFGSAATVTVELFGYLF